MLENFTLEERALLAFLRGEQPEFTYDRDAMLQLADGHAVLPLLYDAWGDHGMVASKSRMTVQQYYRLFFTTKYYVHLLQCHGIETVVLKGAPVAQKYPVPELRKSGDVDLLLVDSAQWKDAIQVLKSSGVHPLKEQHTTYHIGMVGPDGIELELHMKMIERLEKESVNQKLDQIYQEMKNHISHTTILDNTLPVLEDGYQALSLLLHMLHHYLRSGFGLKLLMDWTYFWNGGVEEQERNKYDAMIKELGLCGFSEMVSNVCHRYLGLKDTSLCGNKIKPEHGDMFLKSILEAQEFGEQDDAQMVMVQGNHIGAYVSVFHQQMRINYPKASKCILLWPILWGSTLFIFLRNNHSVRHTSLVEVLKRTHQRSKYVDSIELFRR